MVFLVSTIANLEFEIRALITYGILFLNDSLGIFRIGTNSIIIKLIISVIVALLFSFFATEQEEIIKPTKFEGEICRPTTHQINQMEEIIISSDGIKGIKRRD